MRRSFLLVPLALLAAAPFVVACDALTKDKTDAAASAVPVVATTAAPVTAAPVDPGAPPATGTPVVPPLNGAVTPTPPAGTAVKTDAGAAAVDAGVAADGGKVAPTPTPLPTFQIPTAIPGFDAGAFKPPPGFPSTLPTFPPPAK